jgi:hypothetical protein
MCDGAGQLAGVRWRSTFGRPSKLPSLGDVDPTGSYCTFPDDWLARKYGMLQARLVKLICTLVDLKVKSDYSALCVMLPCL